MVSSLTQRRQRRLGSNPNTGWFDCELHCISVQPFNGDALKAAVDAKEAEVRQHLIGKLKEKPP